MLVGRGAGVKSVGIFCTLVSFARIKRLIWRPVEINDRRLRSHGKNRGQ